MFPDFGDNLVDGFRTEFINSIGLNNMCAKFPIIPIGFDGEVKLLDECVSETGMQMTNQYVHFTSGINANCYILLFI